MDSSEGFIESLKALYCDKTISKPIINAVTE
jgi:hypothetical protein